MMWENCVSQLIWGVIAKNGCNPTSFFIDKQLTAAQVTSLPAQVTPLLAKVFGKTLWKRNKCLFRVYVYFWDNVDRLFTQSETPFSPANLKYSQTLNEFDEIFKNEQKKSLRRIN